MINFFQIASSSIVFFQIINFKQDMGYFYENNELSVILTDNLEPTSSLIKIICEKLELDLQFYEVKKKKKQMQSDEFFFLFIQIGYKFGQKSIYNTTFSNQRQWRKEKIFNN
eukprot:TRINITY_DN8558_c0_g1_i2.p4 TRINITY_DN8558_c0_g1~~TRINITY_DN8558_c0_g1_i2.p4  ORF type:complete len:112 (+),score=19.70 TRINITY_DN8558_c0_g1_i2:320-655(+)